MVVAYNEEKASGIVKDSSGDYELSIGEIGKTNFGCQTTVQSTSVLLACFHKKTYEIKAGDEVVFNGIKCIVKSGKNVDLGEKLYISDGEINFETLEPGTASFIYIFGVMETDDDIVDYYLIFKSTTNVNFNLKTYQQTIKTIDPKYIKDMYYTKSESDVQKTLVFKGEINGFTDEFPSLFEVGDLVSLKEDSIGLNVTDNAKSYTMSDGTIIYIGNLSIFAALGIDGAVDTKEDYCLMCISSDSSHQLWYANKNHNPPSTIEVYKGADPIVRIPEKYLPLEIAKKDYVDTAISNAITKALSTEV